MAIGAMLKKVATLKSVMILQAVICLPSWLYAMYEVGTYNRLESQMHFYDWSLCSANSDGYVAVQVKGVMRCLTRSDALAWKSYESWIRSSLRNWLHRRLPPWPASPRLHPLARLKQS